METSDIPKLDPARNAEISSGVAYLLTDSQTRHRSGGYSRSYRVVYQVTDRTGLEDAARLDFEFDPARERLIVNRVRIIRDGAVIDKLGKVAFEVFRRETDSEKGVLDGRLTAHAELSDVRVGDIVDYATTREVTPTIASDILYSRLWTEWNDPVARIREKVIWPAGKPLAIRAVKTDLTAKVTTANGETTYLWDKSDVAPVKSQTDLPADYSNFGFVEISSERDWQPIVDAVLSFYKPAERFPAEFEAKIADIIRRHSAPEDRLIAALRLVQDEIRYVSLSMGEGSYVPRRPETVLESGFGDCKDKALLLVSTLRRLGIEAETALTDIDEGAALKDSLPALQAFDHVIVKAKIGGRIWWLDPTDYLQGGDVENIVPPGYGFALPLVATGARLEQIPDRELAEPTQSTEEWFAFPKRDGEPLILKVDTIYRDRDADNMRRKLARMSKAKLTDDYMQYYDRQYPGIKSTSLLQSTDDRDRNVVTTQENYELPFAALQADDLAKHFPLRAVLGIDNLPTPTSVGRTGPISLGVPLYGTHKVTVTNLKARFSPPDNPDVYNPHFLLKLNWSALSTEFVLQWNFRTTATRVPLAAIGPYLRAVTDSSRKLEWQYDFTYTDAADGFGTIFTDMVSTFVAKLQSMKAAAEKDETKR